MLIKLDLGKTEYKPQQLSVVNQNKKPVLVLKPDIITMQEKNRENGNKLSNTELKSECNKKAEVIADLSDLISDENKANLFANRNSFPAVYNSDKKELNIIRFIEVQGKTNNSLLDSVVRIDELMDKVPVSVGINEHGNMFSFDAFDNGMRQRGKKPLIGAELYMFSLEHEYIVQRGDTLNLISTLKHESVDNIRKDNPELADLEADKPVKQKTLILKSAAESNTLPLIAKTMKGFHNVADLVSEGEVHKIGDRPQTPWKYLRQYSKDVICLSGSEDSEFYRSILNGDLSHAELIAEKLKDIYGDDFYIEIFHKGGKYDTAVKAAKKIAEKMNIKLVAVDDFHMMNPDQKEAVKVLQTNATNKTLRQNFYELPGDNYYVHSSEEGEMEFATDLKVVDNTIEIYDKVENYDTRPHKYFYPNFPLPKGFNDQYTYFAYLTVNGFKERMKELGIKEGTDTYNQYYKKLKHEMSVIKEMNFAGYFLIVADFINFGKRNFSMYDDQTVARWKKFITTHGYDIDKPIVYGAGRGSAASSLVTYSLKITEINPVPYKLLFARFLNPARVSLPDIDVDCSIDGRAQILAYLSNFYNNGEDHPDYMEDRVGAILVFGTMMGKQALRDVTRIYGQPVSLGNDLSKAFDTADCKTIKEAMENSDFAALANKDEITKKIVDMSIQLEGMPKSLGIHACGKLLTPDPISSYLPVTLLKNPHGQTEVLACVTNVQPAVGLIKFDLLGLANLWIVQRSIESINEANRKMNNGADKLDMLKLMTIAKHDLPSYKFLQAGNTYGVFQFSSNLMTGLLHRFLYDVKDKKPTPEDTEEMFLRLSLITATGRPGALQFIDGIEHNLKHPEDIKYKFPKLKPILQESFGFAVYQEQIMQMAMIVAGFSMAQADMLRQAIGHKIPELMASLKGYFIYGSKGKKVIDRPIDGAIKHSGATEQEAIDMFTSIQAAANYSFNKSHSVSYSILSVVEAYLSCHYPQEFFAATLNLQAGNADKITETLSYLNQRKIKVLPPSVNKSDESFSVSYSDSGKKEGIRVGLNGIKRSGRKAPTIIKDREQNGLYDSLLNCCIRLQKAGVFSKTVYEALTYSGAFDCFKGSRNSKIKHETTVLNFVKALTKQQTLFSLSSQSLLTTKLLSLEPGKLTEKNMFDEREYAGFFISDYPLTRYADIIKNDKSFCDISHLKLKSDGDTFRVIALLDEVRVMTTKNLHKMARLTAEDKNSKAEMIVFETAYEANKKLLKKNKLVVLEGSVSDNDNYGRSYIVRAVSDIKMLLDTTQPCALKLTLSLDPKVAVKQFKHIFDISKEDAANNISVPFRYRLGYMTSDYYDKSKTVPKSRMKFNISLQSIFDLQDYLGKAYVDILYREPLAEAKASDLPYNYMPPLSN